MKLDLRGTGIVAARTLPSPASISQIEYLPVLDARQDVALRGRQEHGVLHVPRGRPMESRAGSSNSGLRSANIEVSMAYLVVYCRSQTAPRTGQNRPKRPFVLHCLVLS